MIDLTELARGAFVYGYPTVDLYRILRDFALDPASPEFKASLNTFGHSRQLADPSDHTIVAMNVDTPYSYAWLDLRAEPTVLTIPPFEADRYVSAMLVDLYTYIIDYVSPRTNGHDGGTFLIAGPGWAGETPPGVKRVFRSPTDLCLVFMRTQLFDDADMPNVAAIQDATTVHPLSAFLGRPAPEPAPPLAPIPAVDVRAPASLAFFDVLAWMLRFMPVLDGEEDLRGRFAEAGLGDGWTGAPDGPRAEDILAGMAAGTAAMVAKAHTIRSSGELFGSRTFFGGDYLAKAVGAFLGILGNAAEEYLGIGYQADGDGRAFTGERCYAIRFAPGDWPPVDAFWSITVYDEHRFLYANPLHRYVINTPDVPRLAPDADGGHTILVQHASPGPHREANWLPCPEGPFGLTFRTYLPGEAIRAGTWTAPPVRAILDKGE
jgi:hypothetical protein